MLMMNALDVVDVEPCLSATSAEGISRMDIGEFRGIAILFQIIGYSLLS